MDDSEYQKLEAQLTVSESYRRLPYMDCCGKAWRQCDCVPRFKGNLTCGIGLNLETVGLKREVAELAMRVEISAAEKSLDRTLPWWRSLNPVRQRAIVDMAYNMGINGLLGFHKALAAAHDGDWSKVEIEVMDSEYARRVGPRAVRVAKMWLTGQDVE